MPIDAHAVIFKCICDRAEVNLIFAHECKPFPVHVAYSRQLLLTADRRTNRKGKTQTSDSFLAK
jgi:hypothetical protein